MRSVTVRIPLAFLVQALELVADRSGDAQDSMDKLADKMADRILKVPNLHIAEIDSTTLGKPTSFSLGLQVLPHPGLVPQPDRSAGTRMAAGGGMDNSGGLLQTARVPQDEAHAAMLLGASRRWQRRWRSEAAKEMAWNRWRWRWRTRRPPPLEATLPGEHAATALRKHGVVRLNRVLSASHVAAARADVDARLDEVLTDGRPLSEERERLGMVLSRTARYDLLLQLNGAVELAVRKTLSGALGELLAGVAAPTAPLHELAALVSDPGAPLQPIHPDTPYQPVAPLYSCFIALQNVTVEMGPTLLLPGTHTAEAHRRFKTSSGEMLQTTPFIGSTLHAGDCAVFDSRLLHAGARNAATRRAMLYFTFANPAADLARLRRASIAPAMRGLYTLADLRT